MNSEHAENDRLQNTYRLGRKIQVTPIATAVESVVEDVIIRDVCLLDVNKGQCASRVRLAEGRAEGMV